MTEGSSKKRLVNNRRAAAVPMEETDEPQTTVRHVETWLQVTVNDGFHTRTLSSVPDPSTSSIDNIDEDSLRSITAATMSDHHVESEGKQVRVLLCGSLECTSLGCSLVASL